MTPSRRRFQAPRGNGTVLAVPDFHAAPALVKANRRQLDRDDVIVGGLPLKELRAIARREVLEAARAYGASRSPRSEFEARHEDAPLILSGHQPELSHPGVWMKNFALNGLARKVGGIPLNVVVDNDTLKSTSLRFPVFEGRDPQSVHLESVAFDRFESERPYEARAVIDAALFRSFADRAAPLWRNWGFKPLLPSAWAKARAEQSSRPVGETFATLRRDYEREWGCSNLELPVSRLSRTQAFARFAAHIVHDPRFPDVYNAAVGRYRKANGLRSANHPVPDLQRSGEGLGGRYESPFWVSDPRHDRRGRLSAEFRTNQYRYWVDDRELDGDWKTLAPTLRPRALTLTLFARVCLGDFFIHGIGGGKYDEVTDDIIRDYFGIEPPAYQVLSATLHLPLPHFPSSPADVKQAERRLRDLVWNPQRHLPPDAAARAEVAARVREKRTLAASEPPYPDHAARKSWFRALHHVTERLRPLVADQTPAAEAALARTRDEERANAVFLRRDFAWVLYPEETLRPFLQRFLEP